MNTQSVVRKYGREPDNLLRDRDDIRYAEGILDGCGKHAFGQDREGQESCR